MMKILKTIAANILSVLALPVFLVKIIFMIIAKAFEQGFVLVCATGAVLFASFIESALSPSGIPITNLILIIAFGAILITILRNAGMIITGLTGTLADGFSFISDCAGSLFSMMFDFCTDEYDDTKSLKILKFPLYSIVRAIRTFFVFIFFVMKPISIIISIAGALFVPLYFNEMLKNDFGIGIFEYFKLFPKLNIAVTVIDFLIVLGAAAVSLYFFSDGFSEWAEEEMLDGTVPSVITDFAEKHSSDKNYRNNNQRSNNRKSDKKFKAPSKIRGTMVRGHGRDKDIKFRIPDPKIFSQNGYNSEGVDISGRSREDNMKKYSVIMEAFNNNINNFNTQNYTTFATNARTITEECLKLLVSHLIGKDVLICPGKEHNTIHIMMRGLQCAGFITPRTFNAINRCRKAGNTVDHNLENTLDADKLKSDASFINENLPNFLAVTKEKIK